MMESIENYYNQIIKDYQKWVYWKNESDIKDISQYFTDYSSIYADEVYDKLIMQLICAGKKDTSTLVENIKALSSERKRHIISLFFIGHIIYDKISVIKDSVNRRIYKLDFPEQDEQIEVKEIFSFLWIMLCLFHDLGYAYEDGKIDIITGVELEEIFSKLKEPFIPNIYSVENVKRYDVYRLCKWGCKDHGIWGGKVFFMDMNVIKNLLRSKSGDLYPIRTFYTGNIDHIYAFISWVIICHNLRYDNGKSCYTNCFKCQHLEDFIKPKSRCINLRSNPLLFLFCLADTLEPTKILKSSKGDVQSMNICKLLELDFSENVMSFNIDKLVDYKAGDEYKKAILSMNDWLIDVNANNLSVDYNL